MNFKDLQSLGNAQKILNSDSEKCLFCLQFKKIIVYSVCYRSAAYCLESVADDGAQLQVCRAAFVAKTPGKRR